MILALLSTLLLAASGPIAGNPASADTGNYGTGDEAVIADTLAGAVLVSDYKQVLSLEKIASPVTEVNLEQMEGRGIDGIRKLSSLVPNLLIPDYGSSMTSSIYLRGFGSRIDNPVIGMYVDDIPVMNKNAYDTEMFDIADAALLRGPQATLYGRNSMCGVLTMNTLSPEDFHGTRLSLEYGNANSVLARLAVYGKAAGVSLAYRHFRLRAWKQLRRDLVFENILSVSLTSQGGYPYREYDPQTEVLAAVAYNDPCHYRRLMATEGLKFKYMRKNWTLSSVTSLQFLADDMEMDQDFTVRSMFTLRQTQMEGALTQAVVELADRFLRLRQIQRHVRPGALQAGRHTGSDIGQCQQRDTVGLRTRFRTFAAGG